MKFAILIGLCFGLSSCGFHMDSKKSSLQANQGIVGGDLVSEKEPIASGVVAVMNMQDGAICTGSLIGPNIVLTAAHCVYQTKTNKIKIVFGVNADLVMNTLEPDILKEYVRTVDRATVHSQYNPDDHQNQETDWNDIAVLRFRGVHPVEYTPVEILPSTSWLKKGDLVIMAGYGVSEVKVEEVDARDVPNIDEALEYGEVMCDDMDNLKDCVTVEASGDGELRQARASISDILRTEVVLDESKGQSSCMGDSGGPVYVERNDRLYLFGITSRGNLTCDELGVYTNASEFKKWIRDSIDSMNSN